MKRTHDTINEFVCPATVTQNKRSKFDRKQREEGDRPIPVRRLNFGGVGIFVNNNLQQHDAVNAAQDVQP